MCVSWQCRHLLKDAPRASTSCCNAHDPAVAAVLAPAEIFHLRRNLFLRDGPRLHEYRRQPECDNTAVHVHVRRRLWHIHAKKRFALPCLVVNGPLPVEWTAALPSNNWTFRQQHHRYRKERCTARDIPRTVSDHRSTTNCSCFQAKKTAWSFINNQNLTSDKNNLKQTKIILNEMN